MSPLTISDPTTVPDPSYPHVGVDLGDCRVWTDETPLEPDTADRYAAALVRAAAVARALRGQR